MPYEYQNKELHLVQGTQKHNLIALSGKIGTPVYVYDLKGLMERFRFFARHTRPARAHYAMKANSHPQILKALRAEGAGADVVSGGEIELALQAGFKGKDIVFSGVGKTRGEIELALKADILQFNVESLSELKRIAQTSSDMGKKARVAFRMNPDIDLNTHPYIKTGLKEHKFGLEPEQLPQLKQIIKEHSAQLSLHGLTMHIGSQIPDLKPLKIAMLKLLSLYRELQKDFALQTLDVGGGLSIDYKNPDESKDLRLIEGYGQLLKELAQESQARVLTEPGRIITARFACLIGEIQYIKTACSGKNFVILNTGMHHLIRPCLYQAYHQILPLKKREGGQSRVYDVVGPICESSDILGRDRVFAHLKEGDFMAVLDVGAYGAVMASQYNSHPPPKEYVL